MFKFAAKKVLVSQEETEVLDMNRLSDDEDEEAEEVTLSDDYFPEPVESNFLPSMSETIDQPIYPQGRRRSISPPISETMAAPLSGEAPPPPPSGIFGRLRSFISSESSPAPPSARMASSPVSNRHRMAPAPRKKIPVVPPQSAEYRAADTNVFALALGSLASDAHLLTGDLVKCANCSAAFSHISKIQEGPAEGASSSSQSSSKIWVCDFCDHPQPIDLDAEETPTETTNDYLLEPPAPGSSSDQLIIFVLDVSGSMCVTSEIQGQVQLKGVQSLDRLRAELNEDVSQQWMPGQRQDVTYVSRLQAAQGAIAQQLKDLKRDHPNSRVALITFSSEVTIIGDGSKDPITVAGDRLGDYDGLFSTGQSITIDTPVSESFEALDTVLWSLQEGGATSLGPAALIALGIASKTTAAKIILCTDGLANVGVGSLDGMTSDQEKASLREWYMKVGGIARSHGTTISVISIAGSGCCMEYLGLLADASSGDVDIVDPMMLLTNFSSLLSTPIIATQVQATLLLHKALFIRTDNVITSTAVREVGNVHADSEVTFEFGIRTEYIKRLAPSAPSHTESSSVPKSAAAAAPPPPPSPLTPVLPSPINTPSEVPFQVQVVFRKLDGTKMVRVVTALQPISFDRSEVEQDLDVDVLGRNVIQKCADLAHAGEYEKAQLHNIANKRLMKRAVRDKEKLSPYLQAQSALHKTIQTELQTEQLSPAPSIYSSAAPVSDSVKFSRQNRRLESDESSNVMYQMKSARSSAAKKYSK